MRIVPPYVLWSVFFTLINGTYREFIPYVLTGRCEGIYYFVFVYVQLVVITPLALNLLKSKWSWIGWLITPISIVVFYYIIGNNQELSFPFSGELCIFWFTYYYLGLFIRNTPGKKKAKNIKILIVLYIASLALQFGEGVIWNSVGNETLAITQLRISSFLSCMVFSVIGYHIIVSLSYHNNAFKFMKSLGDCSYGIYLIHMVIIRALMKFEVYSIIPFPLSWIVILMGTYLFVFVAKRILGKKTSAIVVGS